ncbi:MAG TPA: SDR family oxidoreductase [Arenicellales bacterium]|nr:SDR family oxidoreductase [Arenicellales bacterium]
MPGGAAARAAFRDNVTVITGASYGIGRELALQLSRLDARLVLAARSRDRLAETARLCSGPGSAAAAPLTVVADVRRETDCELIVQRALEAHGRLDTLIINAGVSMHAPFADIADTSQISRVLETNVLGAMYCTRFALPHLEKSRGRIVVMSSIAGRTGVPGYSVYAASKHALLGFFESLRIEVRDYDVSVSIMMPDFVSSGIHEREVDGRGSPRGSQHRVDYDRVMDVPTCARMVIDAAAKRKRQVMMSWRGRLGQWVKLFAPGIVDEIARRANRY